jgi:KTSC domain-containing protein
VPSTVIRRYAYDHSTGQLWVEFVSGRRYVYSDVPREVAETLGSAFAKGVYFNSRIRDHYPCREVEQEDHATDS